MMYLVLPNSFRLARYLAPVTLIAFVPLTRPSADDSFPPPDAKGEWRTLSDPAKIAKTAGVDKQKLDEAFEYVQNTSQHGGLLVVRHGWSTSGTSAGATARLCRSWRRAARPSRAWR